MTTPVVLRGHWIRAMVVFIGIGAALYLGAVVESGAQETRAAAARLGWPLAVAGTAFASVAYLLRFARWHWIIRQLPARVPWHLNLRVYMAGLALTSSPAKIGETLRSALLVEHGVPVHRSLGAFFADRGADVIGMAALGAVAGLIAGQRAPVLEAICIALYLSSVAVARGIRRGWIARLPALFGPPDSRLARIASATLLPATSWAVLWSWRSCLAFSVAALVAYGIQALVFAVYVQALDADVSVARCVAIFSSAMLLGAASMIPGGLGVTEAALVYQLTQAGMPFADAVTAAIAIRLSTLWFAILLGILCLLTFIRSGAVVSTGASPE
jgi:glycosyltransferase 2 family protein